ncbi:terminase small subunit [Haloferax tailed virus 1]|uniref:Terminase small subunit n=1 Tax=Haloferax tailed virus 1 TaxID=2507575 RepID=A0A410N6T1_HFTV1|nr:terminase small subunit [Haloferax tailed virus 1]QAS68834.1 terminase small subunit [Haloferax tailed virus 1]
MADDICGHETASGEPCQNPASDGDSCWLDAHGGSANKSGRPSKLSYDRQEKIATAVEGGKSLTSAARMAGVDRTTVYGWIDRGEADKEEGKDNEFTEFYDRLTRAKGHGEDFYFNLALEMAKEDGDHRFIASLMKQRYPDSWGETETGVEATEITVSSDVVEVTEADLQHD